MIFCCRGCIVGLPRNHRDVQGSQSLLPDQGRQWDAISEQAFFHWKNGQAHGPDDLPEAAAELPGRYRMPYMANVA